MAHQSELSRFPTRAVTAVAEILEHSHTLRRPTVSVLLDLSSFSQTTMQLKIAYYYKICQRYSIHSPNSCIRKAGVNFV